LNRDRKAPPQPELMVAKPAGERVTTPGGIWATLAGSAVGTHFLALADQAVVSGTSFLSMVMVGRWTVPSQLGIYTIALSVLGFVLAIQDALILLPYTIQQHHSSRTPAEHAGISLLHTAVLAAVAAMALALAIAAMFVLGANADLTWSMCALLFAVPFALQREFGRTYAFAHLQVADALVLDVSVAALQLGALAVLGLTGGMSAVAAWTALGFGCTLPSLVWLYRSRSVFAIRLEMLRQATAESWALGKWLCAGQITVSIQGYASYWILPLLIGMTEAGVFAACNSIASLANPLLTAFRNTMTPHAVLAFKEGGGAKLRRQALGNAVLLVSAMLLFCLVILLGGDMLMSVIYHGPEYGKHGHVVTILAVAVLAGAAGFPASNALASMERPHAIVLATSVGAVVTLLAVCALSVPWGFIGAAYGMLAGHIAGAVARWAAFLIVLARPDDRESARIAGLA
jgi:O-antigen/teichoic acid export membrane protein